MIVLKRIMHKADAVKYITELTDLCDSEVRGYFEQGDELQYSKKQ
jgi:hypothetical protein